MIALGSRVRRLGTTENVSAELGARLTALAKRVSDKGTALKQELELAREKPGLIEAVQNAVGKPDELVKALGAYASKFPNESRSADFAQVADQAQAWKWAVQWGGVADTLPSADTIPSPDQARAAAKTCEAYVQTTPPGPFAEFAMRYGVYAGRMAAALDAAGPIRGPDSAIGQALAAVTRNVRSLVAVATKDGSTYYFDRTKPPRLQKSPGGEELLVGRICIAPGKTKQRVIRASELVHRQPGPPGAIALGHRIGSRMRAFRREAWAMVLLEACHDVAQDQATHPILRVSLLGPLIEGALKTSYGVDGELKAVLARLGRVDTEVAWMDPQDKEAARSRTDAEQVLAQLPSFHALARKATQACTQLRDSRAPSLVWRGILWREGKERWVCKPPIATGRLVVVTGADRVPPVVTMTDVEHKRVDGQTVVVGPERLLREGTPVFVAR